MLQYSTLASFSVQQKFFTHHPASGARMKRLQTLAFRKGRNKGLT